MKHVLMIKTLLYTGVRVSELIHIKLGEIDFDRCQIRITEGKGKKDRIVPFPGSFKEVLAIHVHNRREKGGEYLFESSWKKPYVGMQLTNLPTRCSVWYYEYLPCKSGRIDGSFSN